MDNMDATSASFGLHGFEPAEMIKTARDVFLFNVFSSFIRPSKVSGSRGAKQELGQLLVKVAAFADLLAL